MLGYWCREELKSLRETFDEQQLDKEQEQEIEEIEQETQQEQEHDEVAANAAIDQAIDEVIKEQDEASLDNFADQPFQEQEEDSSPLQQFFDVCDLDGDGSISKDELVRWHFAHMLFTCNMLLLHPPLHHCTT